jgi:hypothetical protein
MHARSDGGSIWTGRTDDQDEAPVDDGPLDNWGGF